MFKSSKKETPQITRNIWEEEWSSNTYRSHDRELRAIDEEMRQFEFDSSLTSGVNRRYPSDLYQIKHKGLTTEMAYMLDPIKLENGEIQNYELNWHKLDKWRRWKEFNRTPDQIKADEITVKERWIGLSTLVETLQSKSNVA